MFTTITRTTTALVALAAFTAAGFAGPLAPPAGAIQSTGKTLTEVEPRIAISATNTPGNSTSVFRISQPGSYYLTGNVTVPSGKGGIEITVSGVTIDMNGFTMTGQAGSTSGIWMSTSNELQHIRIMNGTIANMGNDGIVMVRYSPIKAGQHTIEHINVRDCGGYGIYINDGIITDCQASGNTNSGIYAHSNFDTVVERCTASKNGIYGIDILHGSLQNSSATDNVDAGMVCSLGSISGCSSNKNDVGFRCDAATVTNCHGYENTTMGLITSSNSIVKDNTFAAPSVVLGSVGIQIQNWNGTRLEGNNIVRYSTGIKALTANNLIIGNTFDSCTTAIDAVANNRIGAILTGTGSPAVVGNAGGGLGITDPYANIRY